MIRTHIKENRYLMVTTTTDNHTTPNWVQKYGAYQPSASEIAYAADTFMDYETTFSYARRDGAIVETSSYEMDGRTWTKYCQLSVLPYSKRFIVYLYAGATEKHLRLVEETIESIQNGHWADLPWSSATGERGERFFVHLSARNGDDRHVRGVVPCTEKRCDMYRQIHLIDPADIDPASKPEHHSGDMITGPGERADWALALIREGDDPWEISVEVNDGGYSSSNIASFRNDLAWMAAMAEEWNRE